MSRHVISVSIFCFICATHSPCASHAEIKQETSFRTTDRLLIQNLVLIPREKSNNLKTAHHRLIKRNSDSNNNDNKISSGFVNNSENQYIKKIFTIYGNGDTMTVEGFQKLISHLKLEGLTLKDEHEIKERQSGRVVNKTQNITHQQSHNQLCVNKTGLTSLIKIPSEESSINGSQFYKVCPILLYSIIAEICPEKDDSDLSDEEHNVNGFVWLCSIMAIIIISACGVLSLAIIPVMQKKFYKPLIQFLVALAVGTLAGDALLHLLPHAMTSGHSHGHHYHHHDHAHSHDENTKKGCVAMLGLTFFFIMERLISMIGKWRKGKKKQLHSHVTVIKDRRESVNQKNNTQCMDKYNPIPFCYKDIMTNPHTIYESDKTATTILDPSSNSDTTCKKSRSPTLEKLSTLQSNDSPSDLNVTPESNKMLAAEHKHEHEDYMVILREHRNEHHGHSHKHGHVHAAPRSFSSVAWMVIMGDGLHNFTDGMAIGAAFSGGLAGGFSTTVAVFCHELPHELGDFAMLLKAGMTIKQALFYNILSSILCIIGNIAGLMLGNTEYASSWVFAAAAGMFIYIALVDMIPELSSAHEDEGNLIQCVLHLSGLLLGFGIMALIALYEHDLKAIFKAPK